MPIEGGLEAVRLSQHHEMGETLRRNAALPRAVQQAADAVLAGLDRGRAHRGEGGGRIEQPARPLAREVGQEGLDLLGEGRGIGVEGQAIGACLRSHRRSNGRRAENGEGGKGKRGGGKKAGNHAARDVTF